MEKVYIISRYKAYNKKQQEFNLNVARHFCKKVTEEGKVPVAPHIYFTQFLDDNYPDDRKLGLKLGIDALRECQSFLMIVIDNAISEGMRNELTEVARLGLPGKIMNMTNREINEAMKVVR